MNSAELKDRLDLAARAGAIVLMAFYGAGFLVVAIQNAWFGTVEFGLFRTKLLSAGINERGETRMTFHQRGDVSVLGSAQ